ncbi:GH116 family glycosyl-hydrolase, partial [Planctomycetota bacterium]
MKNTKSCVWLICLLAPAAFAVDPGTLYRNTIPEDKQLDPAWVQSLTERDHPLDRGISGSKRDDTLKYIGMPVGGIGCGTVYLSGGGRLYIWDVWSQGYAGVVPNSAQSPVGEAGAARRRVGVAAGASYLNPPTFEKFAPGFSQGFGIRFEDGSLKRFNAEDWELVEFTGTWPVGAVSYKDSRRPIHAELKAYSPFVPLNLDD